MSANGAEMDVLLDAVRTVLTAAPLSLLTARECDVTPDGQPNPDSGQRFIALWGGGVQNSQTHCLDERYSFKVTVTVRTSHTPRDRKRDGGAWALALKIRGLLHENADIRTAALEANAEVVITEPPVFLGANYLGPKGPDWFWADPTGDSRDPTGIAIELNFGQCRIIQYIEDGRPE